MFLSNDLVEYLVHGDDLMASSDIKYRGEEARLFVTAKKNNSHVKEQMWRVAFTVTTPDHPKDEFGNKNTLLASGTYYERDLEGVLYCMQWLLTYVFGAETE
jgi:hypothetical protein